MEKLKMTRQYNPTIGELWEIAKQEILLREAAESIMRKCYNIYQYSVHFDENPLKEQLIDNIYGKLKRTAIEAAENNGLSNAEYFKWTKL